MNTPDEKFTKEEAERRDELLKKLLKTPPQPRPTKKNEGEDDSRGTEGR